MHDLWIDQIAGSHYHKAICEIVDITHGYEMIRVNRLPERDKPVLVWGKNYYPCPGCFAEQITTQRGGSENGSKVSDDRPG